MATSKSDFDNLAIGDEIRRYFGSRGIEPRIYHVRGFVDGMVIVRTWYKHKQRYEYSIWHLIEWKVYSKYQTLTKKRGA